MNIKQFLSANISRRLKHYVNKKYKKPKKYLEFLEHNQDKLTPWNENTLSKALNGQKRLFKTTDLKILQKTYETENYTDIFLGIKENKLYPIRIILYSMLGNGHLFDTKELSALHLKQEFQKIKPDLLKYWSIDIKQTDNIKHTTNLLVLLLCRDNHFLECYFSKLYNQSAILNNYNQMVLQKFRNYKVDFQNDWLHTSEQLKNDIDFYVIFFKAFDNFFNQYGQELLEYFKNKIEIEISILLNDKKKKNDTKEEFVGNEFFIDIFSSEDFIKTLQGWLSDDDLKNIELYSLYQLEKQSKSLHTSLFSDNFDYSVLDIE